METTEHDITATMLSFEHHVRKNKAKMSTTQSATALEPSSSHTIASENTATTLDMKILFRKYREKLRLIDRRMETWDLAKADRKLDTLLVAKLNDFDVKHGENLSRVGEIETEDNQVIETTKTKTQEIGRASCRERVC